ncbi:MAG TPA: CHAT domain-containing protein [Fimbriimonadaceae bacterium]|nr:CHAT domain-containing protein [Fimbriimonadaceae bacterium]
MRRHQGELNALAKQVADDIAALPAEGQPDAKAAYELAYSVLTRYCQETVVMQRSRAGGRPSPAKAVDLGPRSGALSAAEALIIRSCVAGSAPAEAATRGASYAAGLAAARDAKNPVAQAAFLIRLGDLSLNGADPEAMGLNAYQDTAGWNSGLLGIHGRLSHPRMDVTAASKFYAEAAALITEPGSYYLPRIRMRQAFVAGVMGGTPDDPTAGSRAAVHILSELATDLAESSPAMSAYCHAEGALLAVDPGAYKAAFAALARGGSLPLCASLAQQCTVVGAFTIARRDPVGSILALSLAAQTATSVGLYAEAAHADFCLAEVYADLENLEEEIGAWGSSAECCRLIVEEDSKEPDPNARPAIPGLWTDQQLFRITCLHFYLDALYRELLNQPRPYFAAKYRATKGLFKSLVGAPPSTEPLPQNPEGDSELASLLVGYIADLHSRTSADDRLEAARLAREKLKSIEAKYGGRAAGIDLDILAHVARDSSSLKAEAVKLLVDPIPELEAALAEQSGRPGVRTSAGAPLQPKSSPAVKAAVAQLDQTIRNAEEIGEIGSVEAWAHRAAEVLGRDQSQARLIPHYKAVEAEATARRDPATADKLSAELYRGLMTMSPRQEMDLHASCILAKSLQGDAIGSLCEWERLRDVQDHWLEYRTGVARGDAPSAERQMLVTKSVAGPLAEGDDARLAALSLLPLHLTKPRDIEESDVRSILQRIPRNTTVLVYDLRDDLTVWQISSGKDPLVRHVAVPWSKGLFEAKVRELRSLVGGDVSGWQEDAETLGRILLGALKIPPNDRLVILGNGALGDVPFEILTADTGSPLGAGHDVVYVERLLDFAKASRTTDRTGSVVAGFDAGGIEDVYKEVAEVTKIASGRLVTADHATPPELLDGVRKARYVHLSCHCFVDAGNPYATHLIVKDGNIESWQLFDAAAGAELLVLSACETQQEGSPFGDLGAELGPVGSIGFWAGRGGAKLVVGSRWPARADVGAKMMPLFWANYVAGEMKDAAHALRSAASSVFANTPKRPDTLCNFFVVAGSLESLYGG